jgi:hypothetical protein
MALGEIGWGGVDRTAVTHDSDRWKALVNSVMNLRVPQNAGKISSGYTTGGLSGNAQLHGVSWVQVWNSRDCLILATPVLTAVVTWNVTPSSFTASIFTAI